MHNILSEDGTRKETVDTEDETCKETEETDDDSKGSISDEIVDTVEIPRTDKVARGRPKRRGICQHGVRKSKETFRSGRFAILGDYPIS